MRFLTFPSLRFLICPTKIITPLPRIAVIIKLGNLYKVLNTIPGGTLQLFCLTAQGVPRAVDPHLQNLTPSYLLIPW